MFKIEGEGGGPSYLKRTTDSEFPQTFDFIPYGVGVCKSKVCFIIVSSPIKVSHFMLN